MNASHAEQQQYMYRTVTRDFNERIPEQDFITTTEYRRIVTASSNSIIEGGEITRNNAEQYSLHHQRHRQQKSNKYLQVSQQASPVSEQNNNTLPEW
jgi:ABC-type antimicrobial peptide transport system permease subunit